MRLGFCLLLAVFALAAPAEAQVWSQTDSCDATNNGSSLTLDTSSTCTVAVEDVVFCATATATATTMTASNTATTLILTSGSLASSGAGRLQIHYTLAATVAGNFTMRATYGSASAFNRRIRCVVLAAATGTPTLEDQRVGNSSSGTTLSCPLTVAGTSDLVAYVFARATSDPTQSNHEINGTTSVNLSSGANLDRWSLLNTSSFADTATSTIAASAAWVSACIAFQSETGDVSSVDDPGGGVDCTPATCASLAGARRGRFHGGFAR